MKFIMHVDTKELENIKKVVNVTWISKSFKGIIIVDVKDKSILENLKGVNTIEDNKSGTFNSFVLLDGQY